MGAGEGETLLASFVLWLRPAESVFLNRNTGPAAHGLLLALVRESSPALAETLHDDAQVKPFTVSPLHGMLARASTRVVALPQETYWLRFTTLTEPVFNALNRSLLPRLASGGSVRIGDSPFDVLRVDLEPTEDSDWGRLSSFGEIWENASPGGSVALQFKSLTTFRQKGMNLLFPLPVNVFQGYWQKWNAFSGLPIDEDFPKWVEEHVAVEWHRLRSGSRPFGDFRVNGFSGDCRYRAVSADAGRLRELSALAAFGFYCGTGAKTTMGLGQSRIACPPGGGANQAHQVVNNLGGER